MRISEEKSDSSKVLFALSRFLAPAFHLLLLAPEGPWVDRRVVFGVGPVLKNLAPKRLGNDRAPGDKTADVLRGLSCHAALLGKVQLVVPKKGAVLVGSARPSGHHPPASANSR